MNRSFMAKVLGQLHWINQCASNATDSERRALEAARRELLELLAKTQSMTDSVLLN